MSHPPSLISFPDLSNWSLTYDVQDQLTRIGYSAGGADTFRYNGNNQRVERVDSTGTTRYVYDGGTVVAETDGTGAVKAYYTPGVGFTTVSGGASQTYYWMQDALGSTTGVQDASQARVDWMWYQAYGYTYVNRASVGTAYLFGGKHGYYADGDSGMLLLGRRYYLPSFHRFLTQDPSGHEAGLNLYEYASNNPLTNVDPTGLDTVIERKGRGLHFTTNIVFFGPAATTTNAQHIAGVMQEEWNNAAHQFGANIQFTVNARVATGMDIAQGIATMFGGAVPAADWIRLVSGKGRSYVIPGGYTGELWGAYWAHHGGTWYVGSYRGTYAHEYGHLMGLPDAYRDDRTAVRGFVLRAGFGNEYLDSIMFDAQNNLPGRIDLRDVGRVAAWGEGQGH